VWLLVLITISGTMAMHMFVPALPAAAQGLGTGTGEMQMAISLYVIGLAVGQLVYGPLSDARGRRPMLLVGLALYLAGSLAAAFAPGLRTLLIARLVQALGGCAGLALGRAIVRDTSQADTAVRQMALLNLMVMVGPGLAPMIGGAVAAVAGWRAVFGVLATAAAVTLWVAWRRLPETGRPTGRVHLRTLLDDYRQLLSSRRYVGLALGGGCATTSVYAFLAAAPFIFTSELGQPPQAVGVSMGLMVFGMAVGNFLTGRLVHRVRGERLVRMGTGLCAASALVLLALVLTHEMTVARVIGTMLFFTCGAGMTSPAALALALGVDPQRVGSAAGLYGFTQMAIGAACTTLAALGGEPALAAALVLLGASVLSQGAFATGLRR
jgi:DHA1 family bicyclomycin/chloramphenicol resistance-like MFS transporter